MRETINQATEALLASIGIRRKRRASRRGLEDGPRDPNDYEWELDTAQFLATCAGAAVAFWVLGKLRKIQTPALDDGAASEASSQGPLRIPLSSFLTLLRAGAVTAVTYMADRPPAGALAIEAAFDPKTLPGLQRQQLLGPQTVSDIGLAPMRMSAETLLMPGCHQALFEELRKTTAEFQCGQLDNDGSPDFSKLGLLMDLMGLVASLGALLYLLRGSSPGGSFSGRHLEETTPTVDRRQTVTFNDVAGMEGTKEELREVIAYLRHPDSFYALGARPPRGILLAGPSGTGKTLLARAVAGEAGVPFLYASSAAFVEIFVGQGAQRIRQFFEQARGCAPCIVFLDELDAVGAARQLTGSGGGGNQEYAQTLNQLLLELDGIESSTPSTEGGAPVVVTMAATNRYDCLDEALVRPGRLDRIVMVSLPNYAERVATLKIHSRKLKTEDLDFESLARRTEGQSGADLANLLNEAALLAARRRADAVRMEHVSEVLRQPRAKQRRAPSSSAAESWWTAPSGEDAEDDAGGAASPRFNPEQWAQMVAAMASAMVTGGRLPSRAGRSRDLGSPD